MDDLEFRHQEVNKPKSFKKYMGEKKTLNLIQVLRGIASLVVVLMHTTGVTKEILGIDYIGRIFKFGGSGVDIFLLGEFILIAYTVAYI